MSSRSHPSKNSREVVLSDLKFERPTSSSILSEVQSHSDETASLRKVFQSEFKDLEDEIKQLKSQYNQDSKANLDTFTPNHKRSHEMLLNNDMLETRNIEIQKDSLKLEAENKMLRQKIEEIRKMKAKEVENDIRQKMSTLQDKLEKQKKVEKKIENLAQENAERTELIVSLQREVDELQTQCEDIEEENQRQLVREQKIQQRSIEKSDSLREKLAQNENKIGELNQKILDIDIESAGIIAETEENLIKIEAKTEQHIEDLTESIKKLQKEMDETKNDQEKIVKFWKKAREMSIRKESLERERKNLASEIKKFENVSKQQQTELRQLAKFENLPTQQHIESLREKVANLMNQLEQENALFTQQMEQFKAREQECNDSKKSDEQELFAKLQAVEEQLSSLEKASLQLQQEQNLQNFHHQRQLREVNGKCTSLKTQATQEVARFRDLLQANRQVDTHFARRLENEATHNLGMLEREMKFLVRDLQQQQNRNFNSSPLNRQSLAIM